MVKSFFLNFLLYFLFSSPLLAADCQGLQEGEVIRLDAPGGSLANFKTQDQDGLGTCASNAASLLLHSNLSQNPSLSYIQLASIYKRDYLNTKREELSASDSAEFNIYAKRSTTGSGVVNPNNLGAEKWELGIDAATVCGVVYATKEYQKSSPTEGVCRSDTVNIEKFVGSEDTGWKQRKSILAISQYMNEFQQKFGDALTEKSNGPKKGFFARLAGNKYSDKEVKKNEEVRKKYQDFKSALENQIKNKEAIHSEDCKAVNADMFSPALEKVSGYLMRHSYCFEGDKNEYQMCKLISQMMTVTKEADGALKPVMNQNFKNLLLSNIPAGISELSPELVKTSVTKSMEKIAGSALNTYMRSEIDKTIDEVTDAAANAVSSEINEVKKTGSSKICIERKLMDYLVSDDFKSDAKNDVVLCQSLGLIENVRDVITTTAFTGLSDASKVRDFLLSNANLNFDQAMLSLYAYDCASSDKVRLPENLTCLNTEVSTTSKNDLNRKMISELKSNRAMSASICASILDKPKSQFAENECGHHAVGITGMKCSGGELKYLVQNSWGKNSKAKNPAIINDETGSGSYWVDERSFNDGFLNIQTMGRD